MDDAARVLQQAFQRTFQFSGFASAINCFARRLEERLSGHPREQIQYPTIFSGMDTLLSPTRKVCLHTRPRHSPATGCTSDYFCKHCENAGMRIAGENPFGVSISPRGQSCSNRSSACGRGYGRANLKPLSPSTMAANYWGPSRNSACPKMAL
ncbi:MAG: hypothetical protein Ct9H90mP16_18890 [Candidatus Poseidoniales archaeon]|nr:MAG: hypothetical protein Ct9H90mP16_18890 [Candidatus Poseidoniales archaeon]